jgi:HAD superfamily hydrolase (TIGR01509 family)
MPAERTAGGPAFLFDLDGTLVDSVYQHVLAWREAMSAVGIEVAVWTVHRRIGMSGGLMANAILRETGHSVTPEEAGRLLRLHAEAYARMVGQVRPLPGARELLAYLVRAGVPVAIATSARIDSAGPALAALGVGPEVPVVTRDQVAHAKPDPDLFLAAAERLGVAAGDSVVVGDSVWDLLAARRARALGVGLLSGGYGRGELEVAGAYRVYQGRPPGAGARRGPALGRVRAGRAGGRRRVPGLPGPRRPAAAPRRGRGAGGGVSERVTGVPAVRPCCRQRIAAGHRCLVASVKHSKQCGRGECLTTSSTTSTR